MCVQLWAERSTGVLSKGRGDDPFGVDHGDLTALLYMQGYALSEFHTA